MLSVSESSESSRFLVKLQSPTDDTIFLATIAWTQEINIVGTIILKVIMIHKGFDFFTKNSVAMNGIIVIEFKMSLKMSLVKLVRWNILYCH